MPIILPSSPTQSTAGELINGALRLIGMLAEGETPSAATADDALVAMQQMIDSWSTDVYVTAIGASTFTINYGGGGTHVFAWEAKTAAHYA